LNRFSRLLSISFIFLFVASSVTAEVPQVNEEISFEGNVNAHDNDDDFTSDATNIKTVIGKGSEGHVTEVHLLNKDKGSYALQVTLTKVTDSPGKKDAKVGDKVWIYYSQKMKKLIKLTDENEKEVSAPEKAKKARAERDIEVTKADSKKSKTDGSFCATCNAKSSAEEKKNQKDLQDISKKLEAQARSKKSRSSKSTDDGTEPDRWKEDPEISDYSNSKEVQKALAYGWANKSPHSTHHCYRGVKKSLVAGDLVSSYPEGAKGKDAVKALEHLCFENLLDSPKYRDLKENPDDAPKGAVLVYATSDQSQAGDVQLKLGWGHSGYVSDFFSHNSMLESPKARRFAQKGTPYRVIGVMVKKSIGAKTCSKK